MRREIRPGSGVREEGGRGVIVLTPHRRAGRVLGVRYRTLEMEAGEVLRGAGMGVATEMEGWERLRQAVRVETGVGDVAGEVRRLRSGVKALMRAGADLAEMVNDESAGVRRLARVARRYREELREAGVVDAAEMMWEAAGRLAARNRVRVYGYFRPRVDELELMDALAGDGSVIDLPCGEGGLWEENRRSIRLLRERGWGEPRGGLVLSTLGERLAQRFLTGEAVGEEVVLRAGRTVEDEVRGVLGRVRRLLDSGVGAGEVALVAGDEKTYGPVVEAIGWEYGLPVRADWGRTLGQTRLGGLVRGEIDLSNNLWPEEASRAEWAGLMESLLERVGPGLTAADEAARTRFLEGSVAGLARGEERLTRRELVERVMESLELLTVTGEMESEAVELHAPESLFGARYRYLLVMGMAEGMLPREVAEDPVLDFRERRRLAARGVRLEGAAEVVRREALGFGLMLAAATEGVELSYPLSRGREATLRSPWLERLAVREEGFERGTFSLEERRRAMISAAGGVPDDVVLAEAVRALEVERRRELSPEFDEYDGVTGVALDARARVWSASQLTMIGQCPFKWLVRYGLRAGEEEDLGEEMSAQRRGSLWHKALELALEGAGEADDPRQFALERLEGALREAEKDEKIGLPRLPAWEAQRREHLAILERAIASAEFIAEGARVEALEAEFSGEWRGLKVHGFIDRIDRVGDLIVMTDYKSGRTHPYGAQNSEGKLKLDLQIPIYVEAGGRSLRPDSEVEGRYYSLAKGEAMSARGSEREETERFVRLVEERLARGWLTVTPDIEEKACESCQYEIVCRRGERLWRKTGVAGR